MDCLAQVFISVRYSNPIEFLNQLRQTTEPIGGGMVYCDNGEYVEYDVAVDAIGKAQRQIIDKACDWLYNTSIEDMIEKYDEFDTSEGWSKFIEVQQNAIETSL